jgi:hypothetical protein
MASRRLQLAIGSSNVIGGNRRAALASARGTGRTDQREIRWTDATISCYVSVPPRMVSRKLAVAAGAAVATIVLGAIGSGVWDLVGKPGVTRFSHAFMWAITAGSVRLRNAPYSAASLDPTPLPSLLLLYLASQLPVLFLSMFLSRYPAKRITRPLERHSDQVKALTDNPTVNDEQKRFAMEQLWLRIRRWNTAVHTLSIVLLVGLVVLSGTSYSLVSQAVLIWRVYRADMRICAPFMSQQEVAAFEARYAAMKTRTEFEQIRSQLAEVAAAHHVKLVDADLR